MRHAPLHYYVRSEDGLLYRVGWWVDGEWQPGSRDDALREARGLRDVEPTAYVLGSTRQRGAS